MTKAYRIEIISKKGKLLYFPKETGLKPLQTVAFGNLSTEAIALPHAKRKIAITKELAATLHIPDIPLLKLHLFAKRGTLFIGPIVGILTAGFTKFPQTPLGNRSLTFSKMLTLHDRVGVLPIVFGIQHIQWEQGIVSGYFYMNSKWQQIDVPLPNVIYNKLPNRTIENLPVMKELKTTLMENYAIPWFNPGFFSKLEIYHKLVKNKKLQHILPKTVPMESEKSLQTMLTEFDHLYVKPNDGSFGKGIYQIKHLNDVYYIHFRKDEDQSKILKCSSLHGVIKLFKKLKLETKDYIIQQGIDVKKVSGRNMDFRVHTNKNREGKWQVSALACKVSGSNSPTTHLLFGGVVKAIDEVFSDEKERKQTTKKLTEAAIQFSDELNKHWKGMLAEIGYDFGIDKDGKIWLFEANSKPGRSIFSHPKIRKYERITQKLIFEYAVYLTEQVIHHPEQIFYELVLQ